MKALAQKINWKLLIIELLIGVVVTALFAKLPFISRVTMMWLDLIVINGGFAIWLGQHLSDHPRAWQLIIFPVVYLVGGYFFIPRYMWYFALIYLGVSYLSWSMKRSQQ